MPSKKSTTHNVCGASSPTAHIDTSSGLSIQMPTSVRNKEISQKYRKLVGP